MSTQITCRRNLSRLIPTQISLWSAEISYDFNLFHHKWHTFHPTSPNVKVHVNSCRDKFYLISTHILSYRHVVQHSSQISSKVSLCRILRTYWNSNIPFFFWNYPIRFETNWNFKFRASYQFWFRSTWQFWIRTIWDIWVQLIWQIWILTTFKVLEFGPLAINEF